MHTALVPPVSPGSTDILLLGNVTHDLDRPGDFSSYRLGGTVTFAAAVAARLGRRPTIITYAQTETDFSVLPPQTELILHPSPTSTCFANIYTPQGRIQYCYTPAPTIVAADVPEAMRCPSIALLGPIADEIAPEVAAIFAPETVVAAVPQGWMRRWDLGLGFDAVREAWLERAGPVGEPITVSLVVALALVALGMLLVNRRAPARSD